MRPEKWLGPGHVSAREHELCPEGDTWKVMEESKQGSDTWFGIDSPCCFIRDGLGW